MTGIAEVMRTRDGRSSLAEGKRETLIERAGEAWIQGQDGMQQIATNPDV